MDALCREVLERGQYRDNLAAGTANYLARIGGFIVNDKLDTRFRDDVTARNLNPINVRGKAVGPAPPTVFRIGPAGGPARAGIRTVPGFGVQVRFANT